MAKQLVTNEQVSRIVLDCLREGRSVQIDGLGVFDLCESGEFRFEPRNGLRVFLAYVEEDKAHVIEIYEALEEAGFSPWMDKKRLLAGQNWLRAIEQAIRGADIFLPCFSRRATQKRGRFQSELRFAMSCAELHPIGETFLMPVRLEECEVPSAISGSIQYVDLFPDTKVAMKRLVKALGAAVWRN